MTGGWRAAAWLAMLVAAGLVLWLLGPVLLPFLLGMAVAYLFDPVVRRLEDWGVGRAISALAVLVIFVIIVAGGIVLLAPVLERQLAGVIERLIVAAQDLLDWLRPYIQNVARQAGIAQPAELGNAAEIAGKIANSVGGVAGGLLSGGLAIVNILSLLLITPVVAFYLLRDWRKIVDKVDTLLPRDHAEVIRRQIRRIDARLAGFVRGQALVCLIFAVYYGLALSLAGLNYSLVVGLLTGLLIFIPLLGATIGFAVSVIIALFQFPEWYSVGVVAVVFFVGQFIEAYVVSPKLVGDRIGLHPVWLVLAILAGAELFGFVGVLLAAPVAAAIGVLLEFTIERYLASQLYRGRGKGAA